MLKNYLVKIQYAFKNDTFKDSSSTTITLMWSIITGRQSISYVLTTFSPLLIVGHIRAIARVMLQKLAFTLKNFLWVTLSIATIWDHAFSPIFKNIHYFSKAKLTINCRNPWPYFSNNLGDTRGALQSMKKNIHKNK